MIGDKMGWDGMKQGMMRLDGIGKYGVEQNRMGK